MHGLHPIREAVSVIQFTLRAFYTVRTWPWMMLFYKIRPLLKSAQVEKELVAVRKEFNTLKETFDRSVSLSINRCLLSLSGVGASTSVQQSI